MRKEENGRQLRISVAASVSVKVKFIFRERRREGEKHLRNINRLPLPHTQSGTWPITQACALTWNQTRDLSVCWTTPNPLSHTSQHQSGLPWWTFNPFHELAPVSHPNSSFSYSIPPPALPQETSYNSEHVFITTFITLFQTVCVLVFLHWSRSS